MNEAFIIKILFCAMSLLAIGATYWILKKLKVVFDSTEVALRGYHQRDEILDEFQEIIDLVIWRRNIIGLYLIFAAIAFKTEATFWIFGFCIIYQIFRFNYECYQHLKKVKQFLKR